MAKILLKIVLYASLPFISCELFFRRNLEVVTQSANKTATEFCQDGSYCLNGASCKKSNEKVNAYECNCTTTFGSSSYAGPSCEYKASEYCFFNVPNAAKKTFCTNGKCKEIYQVDGNDEIEHRGCDCNEGFKGDFCEIEIKRISKKTISKKKISNFGKIVFFGTLAISFGVLTFALNIRYRKGRNQVPSPATRVEKNIANEII